MARTVFVGALGACLAVGACVLAIPDIVDGGGDASVGDSGATDAPTDLGVVSDVVLPPCDGACGAPSGFVPALFALNPTAQCPTTMTAVNGAADPTLGNACACDCNVTQPPSCVPQNMTYHFGLGGDASATCPNTNVAFFDGGCQSLNNIFPYFANAGEVPPPPVEAGTCASAPANNPGAASATPATVCLDPTCNATCTAPAGFKTCFVANGDVACPSSLTTHHVGNVTVACGSCAGCSVDAGCGGKVTIYSDTACMNVNVVLAVDGGCSAAGGSVGSLRYTPAIVGLTCTPGAASGTVSLAQELTVCCP